jgi:F0F1-type ATP synthase gamma subunit
MKLSEIKSRLSSFNLLKTVIETKKIGVSLELSKVQSSLNNLADIKVMNKSLLMLVHSNSFIKSINLLSTTNTNTSKKLYIVFANSEKGAVPSINNMFLNISKSITPDDTVLLISEYIDEANSDYLSYLKKNCKNVIIVSTQTRYDKSFKDILKWTSNIADSLSSIVVPLFKNYSDLKSVRFIYGSPNIGFKNVQILPVFEDEELNASFLSRKISDKSLSEILDNYKKQKLSVYPSGINFTLSTITSIIKFSVLEALYSIYSSQLMVELFKLDNVIDDVDEKLEKMQRLYNTARQEAITSELAIISSGLVNNESGGG